MTANRLIFGIMLVMALALTSPSHARMVHDFDCSFCHEAFTSEDIPYMTYNVCLDCHFPGKEGTTYPISDGSTSNPVTATFAAGDGSNAMGSNAAPGAQTSHFFAGSAEDQSAAGASAPADWRFNVGWARGLVTCSRCHNPHGDTSNPKLLKLGTGKADAMCLACHKGWNQQGNHGRGTHPMHSNYPALAAANPEKFRVVPDNFGTSGGISLVDDAKVSCSSCHGVHWTDSDAATEDGKAEANNLGIGDGKLLKFDGPGREKPDQSLCQTCHIYSQHGRDSGLGCMVCHGGHEYDPDGIPNVYMLKKQVDLDLVPRTGVAGMVAFDYSVYPPSVDQADGACLGCHNLPVSHDVDSSPCGNCHYHKIGFAHGDGNYGGSCLACHDADHDTNIGQANWVTIFDNTAGHSYELGSPPFTVDAYATCSLCHETNVLTPHANNCALCHAGAAPPRDSFATWNQTCQQGSCHASYHANASDAHDEYYYNAKTTGYGDCENCHGPSFDIPWAYDANLPGYLATDNACNKCHTTRTDNTPPLSYTDLKAEYVDTALIKVWANDATAVRTLYYRIDGGTTQSYTPPSIEQKPIVSFEFEVSAPADGSQTHTLEFWAQDTLGNEESPNLNTFMVTKDILPPVTTSDAKSYYGGDAIIQLSATDNATSFAVTDTYWVLEDPDGTPHEGTTAVIPEPASDSVNHTLYFWSVDHAGNVEEMKSVTFTIIADGQENTVFYLDQTVGFYTEDGASNPNIRYSIYINDELKATLNKTSEGSQTTTWDCPQTYLQPGGDIDIVVDAWFDNYTGTPEGNAPYTYTFTLPEGTILLEASTWRIVWNMQWEPVENDGTGGDYAFVEALPGTIENVVYVTAAPDTTPPVTTSNVESGKTYFGSQSFTLSASDPGGTGVAGTWWQLDSTIGPWTSGTSVSVPAPVSDTANYTLYWYSTDRAGNREETKSVQFSVEAVSTEKTALHLNEWVGLDAESGASGPWAKYQILLDGVEIGHFNAQYAYPATATNQTFNWQCPADFDITGEGRIEIIVSAGFTSHGTVYWTNSPRTYTIMLPEGARQLKTGYWSGFPKRTWNSSAYDDEGYPYAYVGIPAGTIGNIVYSTVMPDTTPPVTTSNVTSGQVYIGNQTFNLTPGDPGGSGVASTRWQLDSTGGIWKTGTAVTVQPPASGTKAHTLYWYSTDHAGNQEPTKSVSFSMEAIGNETATLNLNEGVWAGAEIGSSGSWVNYQITLDNNPVVKWTFSAPAYDSRYPWSSKTFNWAIPQTEITGTGLITIEVNAGISNYSAWHETNSPKSFSITLPANAIRLEAANWTGFPKRIWTEYDYDEEWDEEFSSVSIPPGTIGNIAYATIGSATDTTAPATAINAEDGFTYYGDQTFTLAPDDFGGSGVESTWWELDNSGIWNIGTSISVTAPLPGNSQETHTITWYSRDNVANQEALQSITIYLEAGDP